MSEEYQKFKQNFFKQHPPSQSNDPKSKQQSVSKTFKQYDPYSEYTSQYQTKYYHHADNQLRIQNQAHFPFQQMDQNTFQDLQNDPFLSFKERQVSSNGVSRESDKQGHNRSYTSNTNNLSRNQQYQNEFRTYVNDYSGKDLSTKTESKLQYRTASKHQSSSKNQLTPDYYQRPQYTGSSKQINQIQQQVNVSRQQPNRQPSHQQVNDFQQKNNTNNPNQNIFHNLGYEINKQYIIENNRSNNFLPLSPSKQLPVIFNRPNSHSNSQHKITSQTVSANNSRIIIQPNPQQQKPVNFAPPSNQVHPLIINQPPTFNQIPPPINAGSRVIVQSQTVNQAKGVHSPHKVQPPSFNVVHQPVVVNSPPVHFQSRHTSQGMVSMKQYERLKSECSMWQQKYYQTSDQLTRLQSQRGINMNNYNSGFSQQSILLREQNARLMERIRIYENSDRSSYEKIKSSYEELMKRYQSSLMKEADLLIDRFRLEMKHNERY